MPEREGTGAPVRDFDWALAYEFRDDTRKVTPNLIWPREAGAELSTSDPWRAAAVSVDRLL